MRKIYIMTFAAAFTGGLELVQQLCYKLRQIGYDASMYYINADAHEAQNLVVHKNFEKYNNPRAEIIEDTAENIVIIPETLTQYVGQIHNAEIVFWWLSVDNFTKLADAPEFAASRNDITAKPDAVHFVQSEYARQFIKKDFQIRDDHIYYVADYLRDDFFQDPTLSFSGERRLPMVLYNPAKGFSNTQKIMEFISKLSLPFQIAFIPLRNLSPREMATYMQTAKLYIDFGNHPGMDRMPREAAANGCCVITGKEGAAAFREDVPIPDKYKFDIYDDDAFRDLIKLIVDILYDYDGHVHDFDSYRSFIVRQENTFNRDIIKAFTAIAGPPLRPFPSSTDLAALYDEMTGLSDSLNGAVQYAAKYYADNNRLPAAELTETVHAVLNILLADNTKIKYYEATVLDDE